MNGPPEITADGPLVERIAAGDEDAFMEAYDLHADTLFGATVRFLGDREAAAEVVQEAYLTLWQRARLFDPAAGSLRGWLLRIARNRAIDRLRADARRPRLIRVGDRDPGVAGSDAPDRAVTSAGSGSEEADPALIHDRDWTRAIVRTVLAGAPTDEQVLLRLAYDDGLSQSEIARTLGLPLGTVKSRTRRAMARLREILGEVPGLDPRRPDAVTSRRDDGAR